MSLFNLDIDLDNDEWDDDIIPIDSSFNSGFGCNNYNTLNKLDITFKIKDKYASVLYKLYRLHKKRALNDFDSVMKSLNLDTLKVNENLLCDFLKLNNNYENFKADLESNNLLEYETGENYLKIALRGDIFGYYTNNVKAWKVIDEATNIFNTVKIKKTSSGIYCNAIADLDNIILHNINIGNFIGIFADSEIDICLMEDGLTSKTVLIYSGDNPETVSLTDIKHKVSNAGYSSDDVPDEIYIQVEDISKDYDVEVTINLNDDTVANIEPMLEYIEELNKIYELDILNKLEIQLSMLETDYLNKFILSTSNYCNNLKEYELERLIKSIKNEKLKASIENRMKQNDKVNMADFMEKINVINKMEFNDKLDVWQFNFKANGCSRGFIEEYFNNIEAKSVNVKIKENK